MTHPQPHWHQQQQYPQPPMPPAHSAVSFTPKQTNHTFHLIMTVLTCGLWGFVWAAVAIANSVSKERTETYYR